MNRALLLKLALALCCLASISKPAESHAQQGQAGLRPQLERIYGEWRSAVMNRDFRTWSSLTTSYRQVVTRNLIVSQGQAYPDSIFVNPIEPPAIAGLRLLEAQAVGPTAHLLYFGNVTLGDAPEKLPENILMLKFFQENGAWRFDSSKILKLSDQPEVRQQLQKGLTPDFLDNPEFTPPGKLPPIPPSCQRPEHIAACTLQSHGYETRLTINQFDYPALADQSEKMLVIGGLYNGPNAVTLNVKPTQVPKGAERLLQVDIFTAPIHPGDPGTRVFHYESRDPELNGKVTLPCVINADVLRTGR